MIDDILDFEDRIVATVTEIFETMIMMEVSRQDVVSTSPDGDECFISGVIGLGGDIRGLVAVHMPVRVALGITEGFLGICFEEISDDVKDAIGEVVNMIAGGVKIYFAEKDVRTELAIPSTIVGNSYRTGGLVGAEKVIASFACSAGLFTVELKYLLHSKND